MCVGARLRSWGLCSRLWFPYTNHLSGVVRSVGSLVRARLRRTLPRRRRPGQGVAGRQPRGVQDALHHDGPRPLQASGSLSSTTL